MGRGRAPCCAKVGLNKGSWTPEEDMRLIAYIHKFGHGNWRALPKLAGLLRCGKSCRLRWINYLRPDIKRGNFTKEEEDTIIKLHELLGNKWSKIASCLPGRTDNEIKNVWNTHLKKRLNPTKARKSHKTSSSDDKKPEDSPSSPSSITTASISCSDQEGSDNNNNNNNNNKDEEKKQLDSSSNSLDELEQEIDKIEIPIEPNMDLWNMLDDTAGMGLNIDSPSIELPDISIEPEMWSMIDEGLEVGATNEMIASTRVDETKEKDESERWLAYLENELGFGGEINASNSSCEHSREVSNFGADGVEGEDPLTSYFHAQAASSLSSSSPLDLLY